jgi:hypothetical protein
MAAFFNFNYKIFKFIYLNFIFKGVKICTVAEFWKFYVTNFHDFFF